MSSSVACATWGVAPIELKFSPSQTRTETRTDIDLCVPFRGHRGGAGGDFFISLNPDRNPDKAGQLEYVRVSEIE